jgi:hypothetical protein
MAYTASCGSHRKRFIVVNIAGPKEPTFLLANNLDWPTLSCVFTASVRHYCISALERGILNMPFLNCSSGEIPGLRSVFVDTLCGSHFHFHGKAENWACLRVRGVVSVFKRKFEPNPPSSACMILQNLKEKKASSGPK